jgi:hypothetical protein
MKINKNFKIWLAVANDELRPAMGFIHFANGYAYASDSHILAKIPLGELIDFNMDPERSIEEHIAILNGYSIRGAIWKKIAGCKDMMKLYPPQTEGDSPYIRVFVTDGQDIIYPFAKKDYYKAPDFESVLKRQGGETPISRICLSSGLLHKLSQALGTDCIKMEFSDESKAIFVRPESIVSNAVGLIMQRTITE